MNLTKEKQILVSKINEITNPTIINKINSFLNETNEDSMLTDTQMDLVRDRQEAYIKFPEEVLDITEFKAAIKVKYGF